MKKMGTISSILFISMLLALGFSGCKKNSTAVTGITATASSTLNKSGTPVRTNTAPAGTVKTTVEGKTVGEVTYGVIEGKLEVGHGMESNKGDDNQSQISEETMDLGGREVVICFPNTSQLPGDARVTTASEKFYERVADTEKTYICKIKMYGYADGNYWQNIRLSTVAGTKLGDIIYCRPQSMTEFLNGKLILPVSDYLDFNDPILQKATGITGYLGKYWGLTVSTGGFGAFAKPDMVYNKAIFEREGLPNPFNNLVGGTWSRDVFLDYALRTTRDFNGDGINDQWGFVDVVGYNFRSFTAGFPMFDYDNSSGTFHFAWDRSGAIQAIQFYSDLINFYKVSPVTRYNSNSRDTEFHKGIAAMAFANLPIDVSTLGFDMNTTACLLMPKVNNLADYNSKLGGDWFPAISVLAQDPKAVAKILEQVFISWDPKRPGYLDSEADFRDNMAHQVFCNNDYTVWKMAFETFKFEDYGMSSTTITPLVTAIYRDVIRNNIPAITVVNSYIETVRSIEDELNIKLN